VLSQLRYVGLLETVRIRRAGFSVRILFNDFVLRYGFLASEFRSEDKAAFSKKIIEKFFLLLCFTFRRLAN